MSLTCKGFDLIIVIGSLLSRNHSSAVEKMQACMQDGAKLIYLFTMEDPVFTPKSHFFSRYEVGSEEGVLALLAKALLLHVKLFFNNITLKLSFLLEVTLQPLHHLVPFLRVFLFISMNKMPLQENLMRF